jgi:diphthamide biosynthesis protein 2
MFDDGSRVMQEEAVVDRPSTTAVSSPRGDVSPHDFYEIDRISREIIQVCLHEQPQNQPKLLRVALQFPDELLSDSPQVCWLLNDRLSRDVADSTTIIAPLVFVLGDTTVNPCCPDEVAALHLNADVLVHYGHACLSPTGTLPVVYSFGRLPLHVDTAVSELERARRGREDDDDDGSRPSFLMLHQVGYHHAMGELQGRWQEACRQDGSDPPRIMVGQIPAPRTTARTRRQKSNSSCGQGGTQEQNQTCCQGTQRSAATTHDDDSTGTAEEVAFRQATDSTTNIHDEATRQRPLAVGGLELPKQITSWEELNNTVVVFIMDQDHDPDSTSTPQQRQYVNSMLLFLSLSRPPKAYWMYSPRSKTLNTNATPPPSIRRQLKRRFFLTQKARDAHVFGILVSNLSQQHLVEVVKSLQQIIQRAGKACYSFAVGKINPAKLSNFAEIEVFCLVACREQSLLDQERDYPVPVITPMELEMALGGMEWGAQAYSLDCQDVLVRHGMEQSVDEGLDGALDSHDDEDAPYFSLVTGGYVSKSRDGTGTQPSDRDLRNLPGQGQVMEYRSEAANFLKQREYQGLESKVGETEAKAAVQGLKGIASNYDNH